MQTEPAERAGIPLPTVSRLMATLEGHGHVARRPRDTVRRQARMLRDATGETSGYDVRDRLERVCVASAASEKFLRRTLSVRVRRATE